MRDFRLIDFASKPLLTYLLHALYSPFAPNYPPDPYALSRPRTRPAPQFTPLLVFGFNAKSDQSLIIDNRVTFALKDYPLLSPLLTHAQHVISLVKNIPLDSPATHAFTVPFEPRLGVKVTQLVEDAVGVTVFATNLMADPPGSSWQDAAWKDTLRVLNWAKFRACLAYATGEKCLDVEVPQKIV